MHNLDDLGIKDRRFSMYGEGRFSSILASELRNMSDICAEVANSGCEGTYVEVARYSESRNRWERFAFEKFLGGECGIEEDHHEIATLFARYINNSYVTSGFVHSMSDWEG
jgi:hypothetical protein